MKVMDQLRKSNGLSRKFNFPPPQVVVQASNIQLGVSGQETDSEMAVQQKERHNQAVRATDSPPHVVGQLEELNKHVAAIDQKIGTMFLSMNSLIRHVAPDKRILKVEVEGERLEVEGELRQVSDPPGWC